MSDTLQTMNEISVIDPNPHTIHMSQDGEPIITVNCLTGDVILKDGLTMTEASREFWRILREVFPTAFEAPV